MRPYFYNRNVATRLGATPVSTYVANVNRAAAKKVQTRRRSFGSSVVVGFLSLFSVLFSRASRELSTWLRSEETGLSRERIRRVAKQAIVDAKAKRARRMERNVRWWANDRSWSYSPLNQGG